MLHTKIIDTQKEQIKISDAEQFIASSKFGANIYFTGTVRNLNDNKEVPELPMIVMMKWLLKVLRKSIMKLNKN